MNHDDDLKHHHQDMRLSCPFYETDHKTLWKRERNRLAAKKSRDKKAMHTLFLENKGRTLEIQIESLNDLIRTYDVMLDKIITHFEVNMQYDPVSLFSLLCSLRSVKNENAEIVVVDKNLYVHNQRIERLVVYLKEILDGIMYEEDH